MTVTPEQLEAYESLQDVDDCVVALEASAPQFDWGEGYQRSVLAMLIADRVFLLLQSIDLIRPDYFVNKAHQRIAGILFDHFRAYRMPPSRHVFAEEMRHLFEDDDAKFFYLGELQHIYDSYEPGIDSREYHQREIFNFAKMVALKKAFHRSMQELKKKPDDDTTWTKIDQWLDEARVVDMRFEVGLDDSGTARDRYIRMGADREHAEVFSTGFKPLDDELTGGGMLRGEVFAYMSPPGYGKSLCLVRCAIENVRAGKKVLFVTLEMNEDKIAARFDAQIADVDIRHLIDNQQTVLQGLNDYVCDLEDKMMLVIKRFPSARADVNTIRAYHQQLQMTGWIPDLVVVDYIGEMRDVPGMPTHESREKLVKDLRGFAVEANVCVPTAVQPNRAAEEVMKSGGVISGNNLGDSYGQLRPLDALYTINQTDNEKKAYVARIYVLKARDGKSGWTCYVSVCPKTLRFQPISETSYRSRLGGVVEAAANHVKHDELNLYSTMEKKISRYNPNKS